jgi:hypothetical protein
MSELIALAGAALLYTALAMWATAPPYTCAMVPESHRQLSLDGNVDREHLQRDGLAISRMARRYAVHLQPDTRDDNSEIDRAVEQCQNTLVLEIMTTHDVTREQVLAALSSGN